MTYLKLAVATMFAIAIVCVVVVGTGSQSQARAESPKDKVEIASGVAAKAAAVNTRKIKLAHQRAVAAAKKREARRRAALARAEQVAANAAYREPLAIYGAEITSTPPSVGGTPPESIAQCESGGNYNAVNPTSRARGKWQIMPDTHDSVCPDLSWSPRDQDACAARIYAGGAGRSQWDC